MINTLKLNIDVYKDLEMKREVRDGISEVNVLTKER